MMNTTNGQIDPEFRRFSRSLALLEQRQVDAAVGVLWYFDRSEPDIAIDVSDLAHLMHELGLTGSARPGRLCESLTKHTATVRGPRPGSFRLRARARAALDSELASLTRKGAKPAGDSLVVLREVEFRPAFRAIGTQINGCFEAGWYDAAAVLLRRLVEGLLITSFEKHGAAPRIRSGGDYVDMDRIVNIAISGDVFRLSRDSKKSVKSVKTLGDRAAHHPYATTHRDDIADSRADIRAMITELAALAR